MKTHLSLFSGIGGFDLAAEWAGFRTVAFVERDPFCQRVLAKHWPGVPIHDDITALPVDALAGWRGVDLVTGGFPCQDISVQGRGGGLSGERSGLWGEYARVVGAVRPRFVVVENSPALLRRGFGRVLGDLAASGYDAEWDCLPASAFGAAHERDRLFVVAYPHREPGPAWVGHLFDRQETLQRAEASRAAVRLEAQPAVRGVDAGLPGAVDRVTALGNAVYVPVARFVCERVAAALAEKGGAA